MDILNFISWIKGGRVVNTVDPEKTLLPVGLKDNRRDDAYLAGAITVEEFTTQVADVVRPYKVFTALLTQSGGDNRQTLLSQDAPSLTIGVTYQIEDDGGSGWDFTNVGAPNNDLFTYFTATGTTPANWGTNGMLSYNTGAPVATVLENTIGNIYWEYNTPGYYDGKIDSPIISNNSYTYIGSLADCCSVDVFGKSIINPTNFGGVPAITGVSVITTDSTNTTIDDQLSNTPIEIRVYN